MLKKTQNTTETVALKTTINFVGVEEKETNVKNVVAASILVVVCAVIFSKFAVIDRYNALMNEQAKVTQLEAEMNQGLATINESKALYDQYNHYTWSSMHEDEVERVSRVKIAKLVDNISSKVTSVNSFTVSDDLLTVNITAPALSTISKLAMGVEAERIVESCNVSTAQTNTEEEKSTNGVEAQLLVYIKPLSETK
jgi:hypothetical protein